MSPTDEQLMMRFAAGDTAAFAQLLEKFKPQVVDFAAHIMGDVEMAEDIAQEAFLRVFLARDSYQPKARFSTWLYTIAKNLCYDHLRKHRRELSLEAMLKHPPTSEDDAFAHAPAGRPGTRSPDVEAEERELVDLVDSILRELSSEHREVVLLRIQRGLGYAAAAAHLGCSIGTVKSRMHYAMKRVRRELLKRI